MEIKNRKDIRDFIISLEKQFDVNMWKANGIHLWPYIRIKLFFYLIDQVEYKNKNQKNDVVLQNTLPDKSFFIKIKKYTYSILKKIKYKYHYQQWLKSIPSKKWMFIGKDTYRVNYKDSRYNRYFDVFIEKNNLEKDYIYLERDEKKIRNLYNSDNVFNFLDELKSYSFLFSSKKIQIDLQEYDIFLEFLSQHEITKSFVKIWSKDFVIKFVKNKLINRVNFFINLFKHKEIEKVAILCYYSEDVLPLVIAANQLNIETIEMQHGPQTDIHMSYAHWNLVPTEGYDMLPRIFWHWEQESENVIKKWSIENNLYKTEVVGNFWVDYWLNKKQDYPYKNYILYSLQPYPFSIEDLFPESILSCIEKSNHLWFVRLHPRQLSDKEKIQTYLKEKNVYHLVNMEDATNDILPLLLVNSKLHITNFSGTAIEAALLNIPNLFLNEAALYSFPTLIEEKKAIYYNSKDNDFTVKFLNYLNNLSNQTIK